MARVHVVKKARKNYPKAGIKKGDTYYWWAFRFGGKHMSKTPPKRQQLTQSDFLIGLYDLEDRIEALTADDSLRGDLESIIDDIRALAEEQGEKKDNMPEGLQEGDTGQLLEERQSELESWADELDGVDLDVDEEESDAKQEERRQEILDEIQGISHNL